MAYKNDLRNAVDGNDSVYSTDFEIQTESNIIEKVAIAEGRYMLEPNDAKSNLSERNWLLVRTKNYKEWFGDWERLAELEVALNKGEQINQQEYESLKASVSKVVDENGAPKVVYHGTTAEFDTFDKKYLGKTTKSPSAKLAFFAANNIHNAEYYADLYDLYTGLNPNADPNDKDYTFQLIDEYFIDRKHQLDTEYSDVIEQAENNRKVHSKKGMGDTIEISKAEEWVTDKDLNDYINEGYEVSEEQKEAYNSGKNITVSKETDIYTTTLEEEIKNLNTLKSEEYLKELNILNEEHIKTIKEEEKAIEKERRDKVKPIFLNIKNPKIDDDQNQGFRAERYSKRVRDAINDGNDGGVIKNTKDPLRTDVYYFFEPNQAKEIFNNGEFSLANDNIYKSSIEENPVYEGIRADVVQEMKDIRSAAMADGTFMKAPNGLDTKLDERNWLLVRTNGFKRWFGDWEGLAEFELALNKGEQINHQEYEALKSQVSQVVDPDTHEPMEVYHGTWQNITSFDKKSLAYFTDNKRTAERYAWDIFDTDMYDELGLTTDDLIAIPVFLNIRNPYRNEKGLITDKSIPSRIKEEHDGAIVNANGFATAERESRWKNKIDELTKENPQLTYYELLELMPEELGEKQFVITNPNQVKSSTNNDGTFDNDDNSILSSTIEEPLARQVVEHLNNSGLNAVDMNQENVDRLFDDDAQALNIPRGYIKIDSKKEYAILTKYLFGKFREDSAYGCVGFTADYFYLCDYFGDRKFHIIAQIKIDGNEELINEIINEVKDETFRNPEDFNLWFEDFKAARGEHNNGWSDVTIRYRGGRNGRMAVPKLQKKGVPDTTGSDVQGSRDLQEEFLTPQGELYGFVDRNGTIHLDFSKITAEHPIHEYTHLWDRAVQQRNPQLWNRGVELMKELDLWNGIKNDSNYGRKWIEQGITGKELDNRIASEVHARLVGKDVTILLARWLKDNVLIAS